MPVDQIISFEGDIPTEITLEDKSNLEQARLFDELDEEDRQIVFKIVDKMLTTKKFSTFFKENIGG
jgi:hypothetical protein